MNYAIITVAGMSSRFNAGSDTDTLKCIYYEEEQKKTLLYSILRKCNWFDKVILVGGYQFSGLLDYVEKYREEFSFSIQMTFNPHYREHGSGYSLLKGIDVCLEDDKCSSICLIEGDLFFDTEALEHVANTSKSCLTINREPIFSNKAVIVYFNEQNQIKYIYNTEHDLLEIKEPFKAVFNSGQIWKFADMELFKKVIADMSEEQWQGTNLTLVNKYFNELHVKDIDIVYFTEWQNCNTRDDYRKCKKWL